MSEITDNAEPVATTTRPGKKQWNHHPELPIGVSPLFSRPFNLSAILKWFVRGWFPISENLIILTLSCISWFFFHPALVHCQVFQFDWIAQIFARNLVLMVLVAGGLHLYFLCVQATGRGASLRCPSICEK